MSFVLALRTPQKCFVTLSRFQLHKRKDAKLPYVSTGYEILERLIAVLPALHFKSCWGQSLLVITISSSSWCQSPKHIARPGLRASLEDGWKHLAMRRASNSGDSAVRGCSHPLSSVQVKLIQTFTLTSRPVFAAQTQTCVIAMDVPVNQTRLCPILGAGVMGLVWYLYLSKAELF